MLNAIFLNETFAIVVIACVHLATVPFVNAYPRASKWLLHYSSGLGLGYAFLYLLPKIGYMTSALYARNPDAHQLLNNRLYLYMLLGFLLYYLVDFRKRDTETTQLGLVINVVSFAIYNVLVAITIVHINHTHWAFYVIAAPVFGLHLFGVNSFLHSMYPRQFEVWMKWVFLAALVIGGRIGSLVEKHDPFQSGATAMVGGIIIILSFRLKLPSRARVKTEAFVLGVLTVLAVIAIFSIWSFS